MQASCAHQAWRSCRRGRGRRSCSNPSSTASSSSSWWAASAGICVHMTGAMGTGGHTVGMLGEWRLLREWAAGGWLRRGQLDVEPQGGAAGLGWARV